MRIRALILLYLSFSMAAWGQIAEKAAHAKFSPEERTSRYFESIRDQRPLLAAFLRAMPKGADLHLHLSGSIYAESYIRWAAEDGLCINRQTFVYGPAPCDTDSGVVPAAQILREPVLYQHVINAQSMRFFDGPGSGHDHFFNTFGKFSALSRTRQGDMLAEVASRAASQNVSYLEILLSPDKSEAGRFPERNEITWNDDLAATRQSLLDKGILNVVANSRRNLDSFEARMREVLRCGTPQADPGCDVVIRYQFEIHRGLPKEIVFSEMLVGFELASTDSRVVDVNPVMPEDAYVPMSDFDLHMRMLDYLHRLYPNIKLSLHAGEIWTGLVPPEGLRNHIRKSIDVGHARRIGHGVGAMFEDDPAGLLKQMAAAKIAVEVNLSSNDLILGVTGDDHPLPIYMNHGVPVTISTDDEGVSRSNLTQEYLRAASMYPISYRELKQIVRNSLEYSFLPGASLWQNSRKNQACAAGGEKCDRFMQTSEKARLQWKLEQAFAKFESGECCRLNPTNRDQR